jgi:hypothetical protein
MCASMLVNAIESFSVKQFATGWMLCSAATAAAAGCGRAAGGAGGVLWRGAGAAGGVGRSLARLPVGSTGGGSRGRGAGMGRMCAVQVGGGAGRHMCSTVGWCLWAVQVQNRVWA